MSILLLVFMYLTAIGFGVRIYLYKKTGNNKYKHNYCCWFSETPTGKHQKSKHTKT